MSARRTPPVPALLKTLARALQYGDDHGFEELSEAWTAAQRRFSDDLDAVPEDIDAFIAKSAATGSFADAVAKVEAMPGELGGAVQLAYATPAMLAGMCFAYAILMEPGVPPRLAVTGSSRRPEASSKPKRRAR